MPLFPFRQSRNDLSARQAFATSASIAKLVQEFDLLQIVQLAGPVAMVLAAIVVPGNPDLIDRVGVRW